MTVHESALVRYDAACRALSEARTLDEAKDIRDKAEAMRAYARQAKNKDLESDAWEIRTRAERRLGEMIVFQKQTVGLHPGGRPRETPSELEEVLPPTLAEAGVDHKLSSWAQQVASLPADSFEAAVAEGREAVAEGREKATAALFGRVAGMPSFSGEDVAAIIGKPRDPIHVQARQPDELGHVITGQDDFIATFKGYRALQGMSQAEVDAASGRDGWNYTGKQEVGIRAMVMDECWTSIAGMGLGMMLLPLKNFIRSDTCPCCGAVKR